jgi:phosphorylcholine metabolism protein LicD
VTELQAYLLAMLKEIHTLCIKHDVQYCIAGGTLIGAVRHGGFLPWDDDIDIYMTRQNWERFVSECSDCLPKNRILQAPDLDMSYNNSFARYVSTDATALHAHQLLHDCVTGVVIDILVLDPVSDDSDTLAHYTNDLMLYSDIINYSLVCGRRFGVKASRYLKYLLLEKIRGQRFVREYFEKRLTSYYSPNGAHYVMRWHGNPLRFPRWWFDTMSLHSFEDTEVMVPAGINEYLVFHYGDEWGKVPPHAERITHNAAIALNLDPGEARRVTALPDKINRKMLRALRIRKFLLLVGAKRDQALHDKSLLAVADCIREETERNWDIWHARVGEESQEQGSLVGCFSRYFAWQFSAEAIGRDDFMGTYRFNHPIVCALREEVLFDAVGILFSTERIAKAHRLLQIWDDAQGLSGRLAKLKKDVEAYRGAVNAFFHNNIVEAGVIAERLLEDYPSHISLLKLRIQTLLKMPPTNRTVLENALENALVLYPDDGDFIKFRADVAYTEGRLREASSLYVVAAHKTNTGITLLDIKRKADTLPPLAAALAQKDQSDTGEEESDNLSSPLTCPQSSKQGVLYQLLKELVTLCNDNDIPYLLHPDMAFWFDRRKAPSPHYGAYTIVIRPEDCGRLIDALQTAIEASCERAFEYIGNSPHYPSPFSLRYVNAGTLRMDLAQGGNYQRAGIYATVLLLRPRRLDKRWSICKTGWRNSCYRYKGSLSFKQQLGVLMVRCLSLFGRQRLGRWLFMDFVRQASIRVADRVVLRRRTKILPASLWENVEYLDFEGIAYRVPKGLRVYYERMISTNLDKFFAEDGSRGTAIDTKPGVFESPRISYREFIARNDLNKGFYRMQRAAYVFNTYPRRAKKRFNRIFAKMKLQVAKTALEKRYSPVRDELVALYDCEGPSSEDLTSRLSEYMAAVRDFPKPHLLTFDDAIAYIVSRILRAQGEDVLAAKMKIRHVVAQAFLQERYSPVRDELVALYDCEGPSSEDLTSRLSEYLAAVRDFPKPHLLTFDDAIAYIVSRILRAQGEDVLAANMKKPKKKKKKK